jgi:hypothetical protein
MALHRTHEPDEMVRRAGRPSSRLAAVNVLEVSSVHWLPTGRDEPSILIDNKPMVCDNCHTMSKRKKPLTMTEVLRQAIVDSEIPMLRLSNETGIERASLIRFVRGDQSLRLDMADKLAEYFALELRHRERS